MTSARARRRRVVGARGERGLALVTVIVVLVALALVATPFALSMRHLESSALLGLRQEQARQGARLAVGAAVRHLEDTHPFLDLESPRVDGREELAPDDLAERFADLLPRDPRGSVRSVSIVDDSGRVPLATATPALLGNLIGGRSFLVEPLDVEDSELVCGSTAGFPRAGLAFVGREQVEYSLRREQGLGELGRGYTSANVERSVAADHRAGSEVLDSRLLLLVQRAWHILPGSFEPFRRVGGLRDLALFAELTYDAAELDRVAPYLTARSGAPAWRRDQPLLGVEILPDGATDLLVEDGGGFGPGAVLQLTAADGRRRWDLVCEAVDWGDHWRLTLLEGGLDRSWVDGTRVAVRTPRAVNVNSAPRAVLLALLTGLGRQPVSEVLTAEEAVHLVLRFEEWRLLPDDHTFGLYAAEDMARGLYSESDRQLAGAVLRELDVAPGEMEAGELSILLAGRRALRSTLRIPPAVAALVADAVAAAPVAGHEDLRDRLSPLVSEGLLDARHRDLILLNAADPHDARLVGGTAPFRYDSAGVFEVTGAASENLPNGREQARAHVRQLVSVAPQVGDLPGGSSRLATTQGDFEALRADPEGDGWTSHPHPLLAGPGAAAPGQAGYAPDDTVRAADWAAARQLAAERPDRAGALLAGRAGPSEDGGVSRVTAATVRSALPGTIHFDEGALGLTGSSPDGWDFADGPVRIDVDAVDPPVASPYTGMLQPFSVSFWFELDDVLAETVLFDAGADPFEDRVLIMLRDGELVLRVSDHSAVDVEADLPEGQLPPAGEIRYAFDDGLELLPGVPYHVMAHVGGGRSTQLALFVDGVARGRRSFATRLMSDLRSAGGPFEGSSSGLGTVRVPVADASTFPARGAVRVGNEVMEYTSRSDDELVVVAEGSLSSFGGRARRGTFGFEHFAGETVELVGYSLPLKSQIANLGNGSLTGRLGPFGAAMIDPEMVGEDILVFPDTPLGQEQIEWSMGSGLGSGANSIPVVSVDGVAQVPDGLFQEGGGYAILFCDLGGDDLIGQEFTSPTQPGLTWTLDGTTADGDQIGGAEIVHYGRYASGELQQVTRVANGGGLPQSAGPNDSPLANHQQSWVNGQQTRWDDSRVFPVRLDSHLQSELNVPAQPRVVVIPVSVALSDGAGAFEGYAARSGSRSSLVQVGLDFPEGGGGTEWVRFDTATVEDMLVRDDSTAVDNMLRQLTEDNGIGAWRPDVTISQGTIDALNQQLRFRGQAGTANTDHPAGEQTLPVIVFGDFAGSLLSAFPALPCGLPGRHDQVSLISDEGRREWHTVNHATTLDIEHPNLALVAFREAVSEDFARSDDGDEERHFVEEEFDFAASLVPGAAGDRLMRELGLSSQDSLEDRVRRTAVDSRLLTRLVKGPSGELPELAPGWLHLGEDFDQRPSEGGAVVDELRLHVAGPPGPLVPPVARYMLQEPLDYEEEQALILSLEQMAYPHGVVRNSLFGKERLELAGELPPFGGLLLVGEEIVSYAGLDHLDTGAVFLSGRGLYGTERGHHAAGSPVVALTAWPAAPLAATLREDDALIPLADPGQFPPGGGLLWIDDELLAYDRIEAEGLSMPTTPERPPRGLYRGRFGSVPSEHRAGSLVRWQPTRRADRSLIGTRAPQARALDLVIEAPGAWFTDVALKVALPDPTVELMARAVVDGRGDLHDVAQETPGVVDLTLSPDVAGQMTGTVARQGDRLDLLLAPRWRPGAFDPVRGSNGWKLAPSVLDVVVRHLQPTRVLEHEEWR